MHNRSGFFKNLSLAFSAQAVSLVLSVLMALFLPKLLGLEEFSFWQLFIFYTSYVGLFSFGISDGLYLRMGGKKVDELERSLISTEYLIFLGFQLIVSIVVAMVASVVVDQDRLYALYGAAFYLFLSNITNFIGFLFQAVNMTYVYSISVVIDKLFFLLIVLCGLIFKINHFEFYMIFYSLGKLSSFLYCRFRGKLVIQRPDFQVRSAINEIILNMKAGIPLMLATIASMLILGVSRSIIDLNWGIEVFGKVSFAITLTNFFLLFINQLSMVLFPVLRKSSDSELIGFYRKARKILGIILPAVFLLYIPLKVLIGWWLPQYRDSLDYFIFLLPICTFDGKMQMLCTTYFKVLRKERFLLLINLSAALISFVLSIVSAYVFNELNLVLFSMTISIAFRSVVSEIYLGKLMETNVLKNIIHELILVITFISFSSFFSLAIGFVLYLSIYLIYLWYYKNDLKTLIKIKSGG